jgi:serine/threonine protein phosphatase PrpC
MLAVVCDGVGSLSDGAFASGTAVRMLGDWFSGGELSAEGAGLLMRDAVLDINSRIIAEAEQNNFNTASTLSALLFLENKYYTVHTGDSRIYCYEIESRSLTLLTGDDVSQSGRLASYIGRADLSPQYSEGSASGRIFLVCSDGLYKRMDPDYMAEKMKSWGRRPSKKPLKVLPGYVKALGEHDNISFALIKIKE